MADNIKYFTSESVTEGHPDKLCDQISDAVLDELLRQDPLARVAVETCVTAGLVLVAGEVSTTGFADVQKIVRSVLRKVGYTDPSFGAAAEDIGVLVSLHEQSADIARGVVNKNLKVLGAGDQGIMFGYANRETKEYLPLPIWLAHRLAEQLAKVRHNKTLPYLRPDGKTAVTVEYRNGQPVGLVNVVVAAQHDDRVSLKRLKKDILAKVIKPVAGRFLKNNTKVYINATGRFVTGGPQADTGLTGRKIIVDTYGGYAKHGGGCFSGKDATKMDRTGAYAARYAAKNLVAAGLAEECEVQLSYVIGRAKPLSVVVNSFGTSALPDNRLAIIVKKHFPLEPQVIMDKLKLRQPIFLKTAVYGHFGQPGSKFTWEKLDKVAVLKKYLPQGKK
ncbi:methionine adenosyltransferase [Patescibacteria group bacterium]|nr:methionine adenosyltransferase [Patescibacteria group bacterium]